MRENAENTCQSFSSYIIIFDGIRLTQSGDKVIVSRLGYNGHDGSIRKRMERPTSCGWVARAVGVLLE